MPSTPVSKPKNSAQEVVDCCSKAKAAASSPTSAGASVCGSVLLLARNWLRPSVGDGTGAHPRAAGRHSAADDGTSRGNGTGATAEREATADARCTCIIMVMHAQLR